MHPYSLRASFLQFRSTNALIFAATDSEESLWFLFPIREVSDPCTTDTMLHLFSTVLCFVSFRILDFWF